jgi:hypothetical protein
MKCGCVIAELKCIETRKRRRPSGGTLCRQKKSRRLLPYIPCTDPQRRLEQMASLATALTSIGVEFTDSLSYGLAPRSANRAENEKGGMQVPDFDTATFVKLHSSIFPFWFSSHAWNWSIYFVL